MLEVDVDRVEARGLGDAHDLHAGYEAHRHRRHHLAARELLLDAVMDRRHSALMPRPLMARADFFCSFSECAAASRGLLRITVSPRSSENFTESAALGTVRM